MPTPTLDLATIERTLDTMNALLPLLQRIAPASTPSMDEAAIISPAGLRAVLSEIARRDWMVKGLRPIRFT